MSLPPVVSRDEWLIARKELLVAEKAATRARDALNAQRRRLPMVAIEKDYVFVSRAPLAKIEPFKASKGWTFPWYSSHGSDFNYDFHVTLDESVAPVEYNYRDREALAEAGFPDPQGEVHGTSAFLRDGECVFHTYSTYGRGTEQVGGTHYYLDMTALGRQEGWEEPRGRSTGAPRADQAGAGRT
jgi:predicted dithiol-disulfide oxidoreductase (DUF899 family)